MAENAVGTLGKKIFLAIWSNSFISGVSLVATDAQNEINRISEALIRNQNFINVNDIAILGICFSVRDIAQQEHIYESKSDSSSNSDLDTVSDNSGTFIREIVDLMSDTDPELFVYGSG